MFSESEISAFLEGYSIKDILALRIADMGNIQIAHGSARSQEPELTPAEKAELEALEEESVTCRRCGWRGIPDIEKEERVTGYVGLSNGYGGMLARPMKELDFLSICPKCGAKVHDPKFQESLRQAEEEGANEFWLWMLGTIVVVGLIILGMSAGLPSN
jgi:ribosomal protein L40E